MDSLLVIANGGAGTSDQETLDTALTILREEFSVEVVETSSPDDLDSVLGEPEPRPVVVAGGDGSLHAVVDALHRHGHLDRAVIGLLPLGTGNDFAQTMQIPLEISDAAQVLIDGTPRPVDLITDDQDQVVVNNVHVGAGAQAARRGARWKERLGSIGLGKVNLGKLGYPIGALQASFMPPTIKVQILIDGDEVNRADQPTLMVAIGNGASVGGGAELTPDADPEDGTLDVMISSAIGPLARIGYALHVAKAEHRERDDVAYLRGREVAISGDEFYSSADGEIAGPLTSRTWTLHREAYSMILP